MSSKRDSYPCEICGGPIRTKPGARQRLTCGDVCRQRKCRDAKDREGGGGCRAFTWEMIRGSGGGGVVRKEDTMSGRRYLARKEKDQTDAEHRARRRVEADFVAPPWFDDDSAKLRE